MLRGAPTWLPGLIRQRLARRRPRRPVSILLALADHFEPAQRPDDPFELQLRRVEDWIPRYEALCRGHADRLGRPPRRTYFFPEEQYAAPLLDALSRHCRAGFGEVEVHIHHDRDTSRAFREKMERFRDRLAGHGCLSRDASDGRLRYGFVHGNWALDNSLPGGAWCGLDDEITLLRETGCYADFTLPSAPAGGQTRIVNSIYFADDDPLRPKSHDTGRPVRFGGRDTGDLLLIQGPLGLNWRSRKHGLIPRLENGDITATSRFTRERIGLWIRLGISVRGREDVVFVKLHSHGLKPKVTDYALGREVGDGFGTLEREFNDGERFRLFYVTAREMANVVMGFNEGIDAPPEELFDYRLIPVSGPQAGPGDPPPAPTRP